MKDIVLAGGCFWGVEAYFSRLRGVINTEVGYANGVKHETDYKEVCSGITQHAEVCRVTYDEQVISLVSILEHLFRFIDPTALNKQGGDIGVQYRTGVFYEMIEDRDITLNFINEKQKSYKEQIVVEVEKLHNFCSAEDYHQQYLEKNPTGYCHVNLGLISETEMKQTIKKR